MKNNFGLYLILTDPVAGYETSAKAAVEAGVDFLQLRMKNAPEKEILKKAHALRAITKGTATKLIINDSVFIAKEVDADGVHLGQEDMDINEARKIWPVPEKIFGLSTHGEAQEKAARALKPDYIGVGPIFATPTKETADPPLGLTRMEAIIKASPFICVVLGGIKPDNLKDVLAAGAKNFAVVSAVTQSMNPLKAIRTLQEIC